MIAQTLSFVVLVAAAAATSVADKPDNHLQGVDPNTVSCDSEGHEYLLLPHFNDTSKFFMCAHGKEVEFSCSAPEKLCFDFEQQNCVWKGLPTTNCDLRYSIDQEGSGDDTIGQYGEEIENGPIALLTAESMSVVASQAFNSVLNCKRADSASRQVPYKGDCQRYWKCVSGVPQVAYCSDGLFFNEHSQQCDFEANSRCADEPDNELRGEFIVYE